MNSFNERLFVAGSLVGLRAFDIDGKGQLRGPNYPLVFGPDINEAYCIDGLSALSAGIAATLNPAVEPEDIMTLSSRCRFGHTVGALSCTCGFYAYTDGSNDYARSHRTTAVIEGFGVCTVGSRGFRASKARLVALVDPSPRYRLAVICSSFGVVWCAAGGVLYAVDRQWSRAALMAMLAAINGYYGLRPLLRGLRTPLRERFALTRQIYPDVPVYRSKKAALAAHPLTVREDQAEDGPS